jgi:hypothetical protein
MAKTVTVQQGDTLLGIARANGYLNCEHIWNDPANEALRAQRPNPQVLYPGDRVFLPDPQPRPVSVESGMQHRFRIKTASCFFSVYLRDEGGLPYAGNKYRLKIGATAHEGTTGSDGLVCHQVEPTDRSAELTLWRNPNDPEDTCSWQVAIGHLNPVSTVSGVKARLQNLGYEVGPMDEVLDDLTKTALRNFQRHTGNDQPSGEIDEATRNALLKLHQGF